MSTDKNTTEIWNELEAFARSVAEEILDEAEDEDERNERVHESADQCHYVIYTAEAWDVVHAARHCHHVIHDEATQQLTDLAGDKIGEDENIDHVITRLAFCIVETLINQELAEKLEELEEEDDDEEDE